MPGVAVDLDLGGDGAGGQRGHHRVGQRQVGQAQHAAPALVRQGPVQPNLWGIYRVVNLYFILSVFLSPYEIILKVFQHT